VSGSSGTATVDVGAGDSAKQVAAAVNGASATTGVEATAITKASIGTLNAAGLTSFNLTGAGGTAVAISATVATTGDLTSLSDAINAQAGTTGITAELSANRASVTLTSSAGDDILIDTALGGATAGSNVFAVQGLNSDGTNAGAAQTLIEGGNDSTRVAGDVTFTSSATFSVTPTAANAGLVTGTVANSSALSNVASINLGTQAGANSAISVLDGALQFVTNARGDLGAVQNRLSSTISNLQNISENVSASRSRIQDADFAMETAQLSRNQILQQAGIAMLSQANSNPQNVLSLLQ
jgi:flagellin